MPINSIKKGTKFELNVVHQICDALGLAYGKDIKRRPRGEPGNDIVHVSLRGHTDFPFSVESKDSKNLSIKKWWKKLVETDTPDDKTPILIMHVQNVFGRTPEDFVMLRLSDFLDLLKEEDNGTEE